MTEYCVYVLYSKEIDSFYIGQTINLEVRITEHLLHSMEDAYTRRAKDWDLFYLLKCSNRNQAILIERHIKKMKSRNYLINLTRYPTIGEKLLEKYHTLPDRNNGLKD